MKDKDIVKLCRAAAKDGHLSHKLKLVLQEVTPRGLKATPVAELVCSSNGVRLQFIPAFRKMAESVGVDQYFGTRAADPSLREALTFKERKVAREVAHGHNNRDIAMLLFLSEQTVKNHLHKIYKKTGAEDRMELVTWMKRHPESVLLPGEASNLVGANDVGLSLKEWEVAALVPDKFKSKNIAGELGISEQTVKNHLDKIYKKTGTGNRRALGDWVLANSTFVAVPVSFQDKHNARAVVFDDISNPTMQCRARASRMFLSDREWEVAKQIAGGDRNAQVARKLGISIQTVKNHAHHVYDKVGVDNRLGLALWMQVLSDATKPQRGRRILSRNPERHVSAVPVKALRAV